MTAKMKTTPKKKTTTNRKIFPKRKTSKKIKVTHSGNYPSNEVSTGMGGGEERKYLKDKTNIQVPV